MWKHTTTQRKVVTCEITLHYLWETKKLDPLFKLFFFCNTKIWNRCSSSTLSNFHWILNQLFNTKIIQKREITTNLLDKMFFHRLAVFFFTYFIFHRKVSLPGFFHVFSTIFLEGFFDFINKILHFFNGCFAKSYLNKWDPVLSQPI